MLISYRYDRYKSCVKIYYIDSNENKQEYTIDLTDDDLFVWERCPKNKMESVAWDNHPIRRKKTNELSNHRIREIILELTPSSILDEIYSLNIDKTYYCDIETEVLAGGWSSAENPQAKIQTIAISDNKGNCWALGLKKLSLEQIQNIEKDTNTYLNKFHFDFKINYKMFSNEESMLQYFCEKILPKVNILTGWFFINFDWTYIQKRCEILGIDIKKYIGVTRSVKDDIAAQQGRKVYNQLPYSFVVTDYLELCTKYPPKGVNMKESSKLDAVANKVLGVKKISFKGSFMELYEKDFQKYVYYNIVDTLLVMLIDHFSNSLYTHLQIQKISGCSFYETFNETPKMEWPLTKMFLEDGKHVVAHRIIEKKDLPKLTGGYVYDSDLGVYRMVAANDFSSLYPRIVGCFGISPETYMGQSVNFEADDEKFLDSVNNYNKLVGIKTINEDVVKQNISTEWGAVFRKDEKGKMVQIIEDSYNKRKKAQYEGLEIESELNDIELEIKKRGLM